LSRPAVAGLAATLILALAVPAAAQPAPAAPAAPAAASLQGDQASWIADPHMHAFYELTVQAFAQGPAKLDEAAYTQKAYAIFRAFAVSRGVPPEHMVDHLKLIPGQVVQIAREDPEVLKSYENFAAAIFGPQ
jgi:hypothetical protein